MDAILKLLFKVELGTLCGVVVSGIIALGLPETMAQRLAIDRFRMEHSQEIGITTLVAFSLALAQFGHIGLKSLIARRRRIKTQEEILKGLEALSEGEQELLAYCVNRQRRTFHARTASNIFNIAVGLQQKHLLISGCRSYSILAVPFTIPDYVWERLPLHFSEFLPNASLSPHIQEYFRILDREVQGQRIERRQYEYG